MRLVLVVLAVLGLGYGGLYAYYDASVSRALEARLDEVGLGEVKVEALAFGPLAPISREAEMRTDLVYGGFEAGVSLYVDGHPLMGDDMKLHLNGLQALKLGLGAP